MLINKMININGHATAIAHIKGSEEYPELSGNVRFYQRQNGVLVYAEVWGLPHDSSFFGFHIHEGTSCSGSEADPFANALTHFNPYDRPHPYHSGDLPPLFSSGGYAVSVFLTDRFSVNEVLGRAVIVHSSPDDFTTQPSGNSGEKIACGIIIATKK